MKAITWIACAAGLMACTASQHLTASFGRSYEQTLAAQRAGTGAVAEAEKGLDSEEATIVAAGYRDSLAREGTEVKETTEVLYVAPPPRGGGPARLAPSVPKEK